MRWMLIAVMTACSAGTRSSPATPDDAGPVSSSTTDASDAGITGAPDAAVAEEDAGRACSAGEPADAGYTLHPGPVPLAAPQSDNWIATAAEGCEGLVPAHVPARLSWNPPVNCGWWGEPPYVDGSGDLSLRYLDWDAGVEHRVFFPADGSAGAEVNNHPGGSVPIIAPRQRGFYTETFSSIDQDSAFWIHATAPDGGDEGLATCRGPDPSGFAPNPAGGYVETRVRLDYSTGKTIRNLEQRWVNDDLKPRTRWWPLTTWDYSYNIRSVISIDALGRALTLMYFDPPMSMPCNGNQTWGAWVSEDGSVQAFTPVSPSVPNTCGARNFSTFGSPLILDGGGIAFHVPPGGNVSPSGWYAYPSGSGTPMPVPSWLEGVDLVQRLASGAYLSLQRDAITCARTAQLIGPAGQLCATLPLAGSDGCADAEQVYPDGTVAIGQSCSVRWWPTLGRP